LSETCIDNKEWLTITNNDEKRLTEHKE